MRCLWSSSWSKGNIGNSSNVQTQSRDPKLFASNKSLSRPPQPNKKEVSGLQQVRRKLCFKMKYDIIKTTLKNQTAATPDHKSILSVDIIHFESLCTLEPALALTCPKYVFWRKKASKNSFQHVFKTTVGACRC